MDLDTAPTGVTAVVANGHVDAPVPVAAGPVVPCGPVIPNRYVWLDMPDEYGEVGMRVKLWRSVPQIVQKAAENNAEEARAEKVAALCQIFVEHNGWCNVDGTPLPPPTEPAFWDEVPTAVYSAMFGLLGKEIYSPPSSLWETKKRT